VALLLVVPAIAPAKSNAPGRFAIQARLDHRVDALSVNDLLHLPPDKLVDPFRQRAAYALAHFTRPAFFITVFCQFGALLWLWHSGSAARLRDQLRRSIRHVVAVRALFGALLGLIASVAALPMSFASYRILHNAGLVPQDTASWLKDAAIEDVLTAIAAGVLVAMVMWFVARSRQWYLYTAALLYGFGLLILFAEPTLFAPMFNTFQPLPVTSPVYARVHAVVVDAGIGNAGIYITNDSKQSVAANAYVSGVGPSKRIVIGDTLLRTATPGEVAFTVAHEIGHYKNHDTLHGLFIAWLCFIFSSAIAVLIADRIGFRSDDDPLARLALVGSLLLLAGLITYVPLFNVYSRGIEARADRVALALTRDPASGVRLFVRTADDGMALVCPSAAVRFYFYSHPPVGSRIAALRGEPDPCR